MSTEAETLAARLRQAVQGCTIHQHGPLQAWLAIETAIAGGTVQREDVFRIAAGASRAKLVELQSQGVAEDDPRFRKENMALAFMTRLLTVQQTSQQATRLDRFMASVAIDRAAVLSSKVYEIMQTYDDVRTFMEHHVFAVWDFMVLLKSLQRITTSVGRAPWVPVGSPAIRRLVNQIVLDEESDIIDGKPTSHFEFYLEAMREVEASTSQIETFLYQVGLPGADVRFKLTACTTPDIAKFVNTTLDAADGKPWEVVAAFAIGREEIIPTMFRRLLDKMPGLTCEKLKQYLDRHIHIDGEEHGPAALRLLAEVCGDDDARWDEAAVMARRMLKARVDLWESIAWACTQSRVSAGPRA